MCYLLSKLDGDFVYKTDDCFIKNLYIERDFFRGGAGGGMVTFAWLSWRYDWLFKVIIFGFTFECLSLHRFNVKSKIAWKIDQNRIVKGLSVVLLFKYRIYSLMSLFLFSLGAIPLQELKELKNQIPINIGYSETVNRIDITIKEHSQTFTSTHGSISYL